MTDGCSATQGTRLRDSCRSCWPALLIVATAVLGALAVTLHLRFNWTTSMPIGLYREVPPVLERGALVAVCLPEAAAKFGRDRRYLPAGRCPGGVNEVVKQIVAVPGDVVQLDRSSMAVNGRILERSSVREFDSQGRPLAHAPFGEHRVGERELWVMGMHRERSWDSRYFGPIRAENVVGSVRPVFTVGGP